MGLKCNLSPEEFKKLLKDSGIEGKWTETEGGSFQFKTSDGAVMNWWPSNGTVAFQGKSTVKTELATSVEGLLQKKDHGNLTKGIPNEKRGSQKIFVVHGHDNNSRDQLELALRRLGLEPFILMNTSGEGKTIIEALEGQIGKDYSSAFGIVLLTPDDIGYAKNDGADRAEPRARQNVILETGMLLSSLTRSRMALVVKGHVELPSDLQGIIRFGFNDHIREVLPKLVARLKEAKINVNENKLSEAMA